MGDWPQITLSVIADLTGGFAFKSADYRDSGRFIVRTLNIESDASISNRNSVYLPEELWSQYSRFELQPYDTLFVMVGATLGKIGLVRSKDLPALLNQNMWLIRAKPEKADPRFIHYAFQYAAKSQLSWASGSAREFFRREDFRNLKVPAPSLAEQRAIAHILGTLDDKIELNRRMNETLENIAHAIFKSWFVDAVTLDWQIKTLGDFAEVVGGTTPSTANPSYWNGQHKWATPKDLSDLSVPVLLDTERKITSSGLEQISSGLLPAGTVLLSSRAPIGYLAISEVPVAINQGFIAMKPKEKVSNLFLLYWAMSSLEQIISHANGSTFLEINKSNFRIIPVASPPANVMDEFEKVARPLHERVVCNEQEVLILQSLRNSLIPKLLSGEVRIKDIANFVENMRG